MAKTCMDYGFTLIEVLVALLVIVVGLLGMMSFQMQGLRNNIHTEAHSQAVILAYDMAERMRSNRGGWEEGSYDDINGQGDVVNCSSCSALQIAQRDSYQWSENIRNSLPGKSGSTALGTVAAVTASGQRRWDIIILWYEKPQSTGEHVEKIYRLMVTP